MYKPMRLPQRLRHLVLSQNLPRCKHIPDPPLLRLLRRLQTLVPVMTTLETGALRWIHRRFMVMEAFMRARTKERQNLHLEETNSYVSFPPHRIGNSIQYSHALLPRSLIRAADLTVCLRGYVTPMQGPSPIDWKAEFQSGNLKFRPESQLCKL
jgi:hypothetical protein